MRSSSLALAIVLASLVVPAVAQELVEAPSSGELGAREMTVKARDALAEMTATDAQVAKDLEAAEREGNPETTECVRLRKSKISALLAVSNLAHKDMTAALAAGEVARAEHEFRKIEVALAKVRQFQSQVKSCLGEGAVASENSTIDMQSDLNETDDTQGLGISDGVVGVDPPGTTPFEY